MLLWGYAPEESWKSPFRRKWLFIAVSAPREMLFGGLVSVLFPCAPSVSMVRYVVSENSCRQETEQTSFILMIL